MLTALIDTSDCANVPPKETFHKLRQNRYCERLLQIEHTTFSIVKKASGQLVSLHNVASVPFKFGNQCFYGSFFVLNTYRLHLSTLVLVQMLSESKSLTNFVKTDKSKTYLKLRIEHTLQLKWPAASWYS